MSDLVPVRVQYNISVATGNEYTYEVKGEVTISELAYINSVVNDDFDVVAEYLNMCRDT